MTYVSLRAANGQYVCAEDGGGRELRANRDLAREWETFRLTDLTAGGLMSNDALSLQAYKGQFVCAEGGGGREVVANRSVRGAWETFVVEKPGGGEIRSGDGVALRAASGQYVCAEGGGGRELVADRAAAQAWETFTLTYVGAPAPQAPPAFDVYVIPVNSWYFVYRRQGIRVVLSPVSTVADVIDCEITLYGTAAAYRTYGRCSNCSQLEVMGPRYYGINVPKAYGRVSYSGYVKVGSSSKAFSGGIQYS